MAYVSPAEQWMGIFAKNYAPPAAAQTASTGGGTGGTTYTSPYGASFTTPTAEKLAADQVTYRAGTLPSYPGIDVIQSGLKGEIPSDVVNQIAQGAAESSFGTGRTGAPASEAAYRKALGLTSYGIQENALKDLNAAIATTPALNPLGISGQALSAFGTTTGAQTQTGIATLDAQNAAIRQQASLQAQAQQAALNRQYQTQLYQYQQQQQQAANKAYTDAINSFLQQQYGGPAIAPTDMSPTGPESYYTPDVYQTYAEAGYTPEQAAVYSGYGDLYDDYFGA